MRLPRVPGLFGSALGFAAAVAVTVLGGAIGRSVLALVPVAVATAAVALVTTVPGALATAVQCWGMYAGFLVGRFGEPSWTADTRWALTVLVVVAVLCSGGRAAVTALSAIPRVPARDRAGVPSPARS